MLSKIQVILRIGFILFLSEFNEKLNTLRILIRLSSAKVHGNVFRDFAGATRIFDSA
jgi:hypothetical protein